MSDSNDIIIEAWNTVLFDKFVRFKHLLVDGLSQHSDAALDRCRYAQGARVLDIGCGFGDTTVKIAECVGPGGAVFGVDCAQRFVQAAEENARDEGITNTYFFVGDVQRDELRGPYDHAFARFGTQFFMMPGAAMRNVRKAIKPGGTFTQIVWRRREDNPWVYEAEQCVKKLVPIVAHDETDQVHCGPGPFSMASSDMVSAMLHAAGFERVMFERYDRPIRIGRDMDDAIAFAIALGPAGEIIRLAWEEGEKRKPHVVAALEQTLKPFERKDGIFAPSSVWFITATNPG